MIAPITRFLCLSLLVTSWGDLYAADSPPSSRTNIILVMPDDVGYGDYSGLGAPILKTPAVDGFKKQSLLLTKFHVSPTCSPTRAALFSGRHEFKNGVTHTIFERERMSLKTITLPQVLKTAGYTTGIFGKWHLGDEEAYRPENRGFDEVYIHGGGGIGQTYSGSCGDVPGNTNINPTLWHNGEFVKTEGYCTDLFFEQAMDWIDGNLAAKKPFFAFIPLNAAHTPLVLPKKYYQHHLGKQGVSKDVAKFYGMIENVDANFGKLLALLDERGAANDTLVIYIGSDNGGSAPACEIFNAGMRGNKGMPYQGGTRVPCFFRWPAGGISAGRDCDALAAHIDIFPTLAGIAGATASDEVKKQVEGRNLQPLLKNAKAEWPERTLVHHVGRWGKGESPNGSKYKSCAIQNSRFTLVNNTALYDLKADPRETTNVIADHPDVVASLRATYEQWWADVQAYLVNETAIGPTINPFKAMYWTKFGGGPTGADMKRMDPTSVVIPR
jgi:arylsulfatase A-like enzyme